MKDSTKEIISWIAVFAVAFMFNDKQWDHKYDHD